MVSDLPDGGTIRVSRAFLRDNRRATREGPLLRGQPTEAVESDHVEIPVPAAATDDLTEVRVLHVDDDPEINELTKTFLERVDDDISVVAETSVVTALEHLRADNLEFDCIVSDYDMPNTNGLEFLEIVREEHPDLPFILFTGKGSEEIASGAISAGVTDYMQKGSGTEQYEMLANRVRNAAERYRTQRRFWDALSWYRRLVEQSLAGVFIVQDTELVYVNEHFTEIFGYSRRELVGSSPGVLIGDFGDAAALLDHLTGDPRVTDTFQYEFTGEHRDGTEIPVEVHGGTITYDGDPGYIGILWDRSE
ncbi:PAS domain S-box protein [Halobacteriales archaeon SW_7_65_23]|nr:MAG: PAS domain S-box protein [Halobacteriales archaeon SW_7_65_23]